MRFYSGFSFKLKWRYLKWLAIPLFAILSYFSGAFGFINVNATSNYNTQYNIDVPNYDSEFNNYTCGTENVKDFLHSFIDYYNNNTNYANLIIFPTNNQIIFFAYYKNNTNVNRFSLFMNSTGKYNLKYMYNNTGVSSKSWTYYLSYKTCSSNISTSESFLKFKDYLFNNNVPSNLNTQWSDNVGSFRYYYTNQADIVSGMSTSYSSIDNDTSYDIDSEIFTNVDRYFTFPYWSNRNLNFKAFSDSEVSSSSTRYKNLHINQNNTTYNYLDDIPTYFDLLSYYDNTPPSTPLTYSFGSNDRLRTLYSNLDPNDLNNFKININFDTNIDSISAYDYTQNIDFTNTGCYGRINHNDNYYTYEKFSSCDFEINFDDQNISSSNNIVDFSLENFAIYDSNNNQITNFSNYDKIFFYIHFQYNDDTLNSYVNNLEFNSIANLFYSDNFKGEIYDNFSLPSYFKIFITNTGFSNNMSSNFSIKTISGLTSNNFLYSQPYNTSTLLPTQIYGFVSTNFQNYLVNNSQNIGYMIYHQINNLNTNIVNNIDMILMRDIVISFRDFNSSNFYYVDSNGDIVNNDITIDYSQGVEESFGDITGIFPPGPLDSLLNIPFKYLSKTINSLGETCSPLSIPFVFDSELTFPCFDTYYEEFPSSLKLFTEVVPCAFILIFYFKHLYKKISRATTLETTDNDEWGCL